MVFKFKSGIVGETELKILNFKNLQLQILDPGYYFWGSIRCPSIRLPFSIIHQ